MKKYKYISKIRNYFKMRKFFLSIDEVLNDTLTLDPYSSGTIIKYIIEWSIK